MTNPSLINADCLDALVHVPDKSIHLILTDEPFGTTRNPWDTPIPQDKIWEHKKRILAPGGAIVHFATEPYTSILITGNMRGYKHKWIWNKRQSGNFAVAKHQPLSIFEEIPVFDFNEDNEDVEYEEIVVFSAEGKRIAYYPKMRTGKMRMRGSKNSDKHGRGFGGMNQVYYQSNEYYPTNILDFPAVSRKKSLHPSEKPVPLLEYLIKTYSLTGETVLDYAMGSGSTGEAALGTNRTFIGIERDADIFKIAQKRIDKWQQHQN